MQYFFFFSTGRREAVAIPPPLCCIGLTSPVFERVTSPIRAAADRGILNIETKCSLVWANGWAPRLVHDGFFWRWLPTRYVFHLISIPSSPRNPNKRGIGLSPTVKWSGKQKLVIWDWEMLFRLHVSLTLHQHGRSCSNACGPAMKIHGNPQGANELLARSRITSSD